MHLLSRNSVHAVKQSGGVVFHQVAADVGLVFADQHAFDVQAFAGVGGEVAQDGGSARVYGVYAGGAGAGHVVAGEGVFVARAEVHAEAVVLRVGEADVVARGGYERGVVDVYGCFSHRSC